MTNVKRMLEISHLIISIAQRISLILLAYIYMCQLILGKGSEEEKKRISYGLFTDKKIYTHFFWKLNL